MTINRRNPIARTAIVLSLFAATSALAQQQTPAEQAFATKLMKEIQDGLNCSVSLIATQAELAKVQAELAKANAQIESKPKGGADEK